MEQDLAMIRDKIRAIPDYPKKGIVFRDITPVLKDPVLFSLAVSKMQKLLEGLSFDYVVGIESRGFIFGAALAHAIGKGFIPARKEGKLPYKKISRSYALEYSTATLEMHSDALEKGSSVVIVDDLLATGGTAKAAAELVESLGARVSGYAFLIELSDLKGREKLAGGKVISLISYHGD